jgi:hypothetical protein
MAKFEAIPVAANDSGHTANDQTSSTTHYLEVMHGSQRFADVADVARERLTQKAALFSAAT